jgi:pyruvate/2-oxoglutarate/acetoin dehydrogenase E1 component
MWGPEHLSHSDMMTNDKASCGVASPGLVSQGLVRSPRKGAIPQHGIAPFRYAVNQAMRELAEDSRTIFVGQSVRYPGAAIYSSLDGVPDEKRLEMPITENFQAGFCIGLALTGRIPICIYPRMDFLLLAMDQLVGHLDKAPLFGWRPKVIIRTMVGQKNPLNAGPQHTQNHTQAFRLMLQTIDVCECRTPDAVLLDYQHAIESDRSTLIVENPSWGD